MITPKNPIRIEWSFLAMMIALCAILTALQYRWTGELANAEATRLRGNLTESAQQVSHAFDSELSESCAQLLPSPAEVDSLGREQAHVARFIRWTSTTARPVFRRVALVVRAGGVLQPLELNRHAAQPEPMEWPPEWQDLREDLMRRLKTPGGPRFVSPSGMLLSFAVFGGPRPTGGPNIGWLIVEIDSTYVREVWLPGLVRRFLDPDGNMFQDVEVKSAQSPATVIYSSGVASVNFGEPEVKVRMNFMGRSPDDAGGSPESGRWILEVRPRPGALEAVVSKTRQHNFTLAIFLNALLLAAGALLVRHTRRSRQLAEAQMNFVTNVSHELRTPLTVIRGAAHNLQRGVVQEPARIEQYAGLILQHVEQLASMVEQVLGFADIRRSSLAISRQSISLAGVLRDSVAACEPETLAAHCEVELEISPSLPSVEGDAAALRRMFQNLIANAAKHGGEGGWIGIVAASRNGSRPAMIEVRITDRGPGIPEREQAEIFTQFYRGAVAQEKQIRGSGLGLSLAREIVEAHGGRISVDSKAGHGAIFIVHLPRTASQQ